MSHDNLKPMPVGGKFFTGPMKIVFAVFLAGFAAIAYRFLVGIGPVSGMNDGYPWGIWIAYDVVTGTAIACGGYAVAILCYVFNKGKYHPLVRPAVLTSALGYSLAGFSIIFDVGLYWNIWKVPVQFWNWNANSALLEVALCVMAYCVVLWLELVPAILEKFEADEKSGMYSLAKSVTPVLNKALPFILALGLLLPTMHQSSLGSLMLTSVGKLHKLWHTPLLPLLFLISVVAMGYGAVILESQVAARAFKRPKETKILGDMSIVMVYLIFAYLAIRLLDIVLRGRLGLIFQFNLPSFMFLVEMALFIASAVMLLDKEARYKAKVQFQAGMMMVIAGALYRFDAYLVAWNPGGNFSYFPSVLEQLMTYGVIALEIMGYVWFVRTFPILGGAVPASQKARR